MVTFRPKLARQTLTVRILDRELLENGVWKTCLVTFILIHDDSYTWPGACITYV